MNLTYDQIADLVLLTKETFIKEGAFINMQTDLQDYTLVRELWQNRKMRFDGGSEWSFNVQMDHNHSARVVGLFQVDGGSINDTMVRGAVNPRFLNAHYNFDLKEQEFQRGGKAIVDLVETRFSAMRVSLFELMETLLWGKPEDSSDKLTPYGIAYWVTRGTGEGFTGGNPSGFADGKAGIDANRYPRWKNWSASYGAVSKEDLIRKMRTAHRKTQFRSPLSHAVPTVSTGNGIFVNSDTTGAMEVLLEEQNMNLGNDLASKDGRTVFKSTPITYAPYLDNDTTNPVYMLDFKNIAIGVMAGWENNVTGPKEVAGMSHVRRVDMDLSMNMVGLDLRRLAVFYKGA